MKKKGVIGGKGGQKGRAKKLKEWRKVLKGDGRENETREKKGRE